MRSFKKGSFDLVYLQVILLSHQGLPMVHQKAFGLLADGSIDENVDPASLKRCINFVVGEIVFIFYFLLSFVT